LGDQVLHWPTGLISDVLLSSEAPAICTGTKNLHLSSLQLAQELAIERHAVTGGVAAFTAPIAVGCMVDHRGNVVVEASLCRDAGCRLARRIASVIGQVIDADIRGAFGAFDRCCEESIGR